MVTKTVMEKFRYRKQKQQTLQDGDVMQKHLEEAFLQENYNPNTTHNPQDMEYGFGQLQLTPPLFGHDHRLQHDHQFSPNKTYVDKQNGQSQKHQQDQTIGNNRRQHDKQFMQNQKQYDQQFDQHKKYQCDQQFDQHKKYQCDQQFSQNLLLQQDQQFDHNKRYGQQFDQNLKDDQQFGHNHRHPDQQFGHNQRQHDQHFGYNQKQHDQQFDQNIKQHDQQFDQNIIQQNQQLDQNIKHDQQFGQNQRQQNQESGHGQRHQQNQQVKSDHKQFQSEQNQRQKQQQQYVPDLRQHNHQNTESQKTVKQHTDWNGLMQDLFGMELPQTAESIHESASSGIASDVTSVYPATSIMTTFKGGDSAGSASSAKSTASRDSGTKSVSVSGSPGPDQTFDKPLSRGARRIPAIPKNGPPILAKNMQCITSPCPQNGHIQANGFSLSPAGFSGEKNHSRERRQRRPEANCIQCSNIINYRPYKRHIDSPLNCHDCRTVDPSFCCELDQCFVDDRGQDHFDSFGDDRFIEYPFQDKSASRDRLHLTSPPMCPAISPGLCCGQAIHQNNRDLYLPSEKAPPNLQPWHKHQQLQHNHQLQQHSPQTRYSPMDSDNNRNINFDTCNNHNHHNIPQSSQCHLDERTSSPILQTFKPNIKIKPSRTPCNYQASKPALQSPHDAIEKHPQNVITRSQTPKKSQILITHAQIHTPSPQPRSRNESKARSAHIQPEPQVNNFLSKSQFGREVDLSRYLVTGINNLSLSQVDNAKGKTTLMQSSCKHMMSKIAPFEYLPNEVLLKIFGHLSTNNLCRCAQVCRLWYNAVWDNPILWTSIVINSENIDVDRALKYLTRRLSYNTPKVCMILEKININTCCRLSDHGLQTVAKRCPELRYLDMQGCHLITNLGVKEAVSRCVNLERLDVTGCPLVTCLSLMDSLISQSASRHLQRIYLRYLDMTDCPNVTDEDLCITTSQCTQLLFLYLRRCPLITDLGVTYIANNCCSLRELSLSDCKNVTDLGMRELAKLRENLRYLSVAKCEKVSDQGVIHIARNCSKLRYLNVRGCEAFSDTGLDFLAKNCPRLRSLDIGKCDITDDGLYALSMHCPNLRKLGMKSCDAITDKGIVLIAYRCSSLQQLHVQDCCLSPDAYAMVRRYCKRAIIEHTNPAIL